ncbi:MAG TPA: class I SAM-dependent methyltransferase [Pseudonocardia sp.]|nr:class I SAM-dependent methyltransferase [Pseudonocardia sp.]
MDASGWDARYCGTDLIWSAGPNRTVAEQVEGLAIGTALDLGAGEGRNAVWLAEHGWKVTAVDFSVVGLEKAQEIARRRGVEIETVVADVLDFRAPGAFDLVVLAYLQLPMEQLAHVLQHSAAALSPGGTLLLVAHDRSNLVDGVGGPQDPEVLPTPEEVTAVLPGLRVERAELIRRPVEVDGVTRYAIDTLVRARRPTG